MTPFQECAQLKIERRKTTDQKRIDAIDARCRVLADLLSHDEAVFLVRKYELQ